jgi:hypothetical protein
MYLFRHWHNSSKGKVGGGTVRLKASTYTEKRKTYIQDSEHLWPCGYCDRLTDVSKSLTYITFSNGTKITYYIA